MAQVTVFDPRTPSIARVYDYLLGGKDNFPADRGWRRSCCTDPDFHAARPSPRVESASWR
jgi:S-adenosyl methyltransferase